MKVVILAGGFGTRLAEETEVKPKPMVEIGGRPILWHIMRHYSSHGFNEFYVALGYKGEVIKNYFLNYHAMAHDITVDTRTGDVSATDGDVEDWKVHLVNTGLTTHTGGRVKRLENLLGNEPFLVTYGDGVANIDLRALVAYHRAHGRTATITAVRPPARFGGVVFDDGDRIAFTEKPQSGEGWINGGYMVLEPAIFKYIEGDETSLEAQTLERLAANDELRAYRHADFWQCMDTMRDVTLLRNLWDGGRAPWRTW